MTHLKWDMEHYEFENWKNTTLTRTKTSVVILTFLTYFGTVKIIKFIGELNRTAQEKYYPKTRPSSAWKQEDII